MLKQTKKAVWKTERPFLGFKNNKDFASAAMPAPDTKNGELMLPLRISELIFEKRY
jgi:hypothetical protein